MNSASLPLISSSVAPARLGLALDQAWLASPRRAKGLLAGVLALAFLLRLGAALTLGEPTIHGNESVNVARSLVAGQGFAFDFYHTRPDQPLQSFMPPLHPLFIAFFLRFFANPALALWLTQALLATLNVLLVYGITVKLSESRAVGLLAALGMACYPVFLVMTASPASLTFNFLLIALLIWASLLLRERMDTLSAAAAGLVLGLTLLTRPNLLGYLAILPAWLWLNRPGQGRRLLALTALTAATTLLVLSPWLVRTARIHSRLVYISTNGGATLWNGNNPFTTGSGHEVDRDRLAGYLGLPVDSSLPSVYDLQPYPLPPEIQAQAATLDEVELDRALRAAALDFIRVNPQRWAQLAGQKLLGFWWFRSNVGGRYEESWTRYYRLLYAGLLALTLAGVVFSLRSWRSYSLLYGLVLYSALMAIIFHVQTRFRWEVEAFFLVFAALAVAWLLERLGAGRGMVMQHA